MTSIGPTLPPHLAKRKRTPEDDGAPNSPPSKVTRHTNPNELVLDSDSDDDYGPSAPPVKSNGPGIASKSTNAEEISLDDSDSDDTGPAPAAPPKQAAAATIGPSLPPKRTFGPAPPPAPLSERPRSPPSDSDSDSDYGPALPTEAQLAVAAARPSHSNTDDLAATASTAPQRDSWMLAPPTASGPRANDPTQIKARKFASGRAGSSAAPAGISSIWTETAEEKKKRLADAVLGRNADAVPAQATGPSRKRDKAQEERDARIRSAIDSTRGKSLYEEHQAARKDGRVSDQSAKGRAAMEEEDDPSKRAFDREKDMGLGLKISSSQRRELLTKSADFGGRFQKGSFL